MRCFPVPGFPPPLDCPLRLQSNVTVLEYVEEVNWRAPGQGQTSGASFPVQVKDPTIDCTKSIGSLDMSVKNMFYFSKSFKHFKYVRGLVKEEYLMMIIIGFFFSYFSMKNMVYGYTLEAPGASNEYPQVASSQHLLLWRAEKNYCQVFLLNKSSVHNY